VGGDRFLKCLDIGISPMATIEIKLFSTFQYKTGISRLTYEGPPLTVDKLIDWMQEQVTRQGKQIALRGELVFPDGRIKPGAMILMDGHNVLHKNGIDTLISGKIVSIFPPSGGG
jgi:molybdopterin synthase sulfur carrier subunit